MYFIDYKFNKMPGLTGRNRQVPKKWIYPKKILLPKDTWLDGVPPLSKETFFLFLFFFDLIINKKLKFWKYPSGNSGKSFPM